MTRTRAMSAPNAEITTSRLMLALSGLFLLNLLLRVFYLRYDFVNGDEGVRALTAVRMLEGARLYVDVVTDKPPGASLFYAAVFALFGNSMKAVHAAAIVWNFGTAAVVYLIAARFYTRRIGLWAALLFVYFSTNYFTQDMMAANTELLMALPYTAAFYCFMIGRAANFINDSSNRNSRAARLYLIAAGVLTGLATMFKQIGVLNLVFFIVFEIVAAWNGRHHENHRSVANSLRRGSANIWPILLGFMIVVAALFVWLGSMDAVDDFWRNTIALGVSYADATPAGLWIKFMIGRGMSYLLFNAALLLLAASTVWLSIRGYQNRSDKERGPRRFVLTVGLWCAVSLMAVITGGRFFGHYFIPALPALALLGSLGVKSFRKMISDPSWSRQAKAGLAVLIVFLLIGVIRSHHRTAVLAYETLTGTRTRWSASWGMTRREEESEAIANFVRARVSAGEPLYIWGYAHDVFWRTGCRPASRYLTPSYIDGRFPDTEALPPASGEEFRREAAAKTLIDLQLAMPKLILDIGGGLMALPHDELVGFIDDNYIEEETIGPLDSQMIRVLRQKGEEEKRRETLERERRKQVKRQRSGV